MILTELISGILQVLLFALVPFIVYLIRHRTIKGFFHYIGLHQTTKGAIGLALLTSLLFVAGGLLVALLNPAIKELMTTPPAVQGKLKAMGLTGESVIVLLVIAWVKTSLSEEILFRGFIGKRLISKMGFAKGNLLQAFIFALVHVLLFSIMSHAGTGFLVFIFLLSGVAGYIVGYINEKKGKGSIIPGWIAHGLGNTIAYYVVAYVL